MIKTKDYEIIAIEKDQFNAEVLREYVNAEFVNVYMVILDEGRYLGFFNNTILLEEMKQNKFWREDCLVLDFSGGGRQLFREARKYFADIKNRKYPLPVVAENGQVLTFLVWDQHLEKPEGYLEKQKQKIAGLLKAGYKLRFNNWDEYTNEYVCGIREGDAEDYRKIKCQGRNWELYNMLEDYPVDISQEGLATEVLVDDIGIHYPVQEHEIIPLMDMVEGLRPYHNKRIYAWLRDDKINSVIGKMIFQYGYWIEGFCELSTCRELTALLGKKIVDLEDIIENEDVLILVYGQEEVRYLDEHFQQGKGILWNEMFNLKKDIINREKFQTWGKREEIDFYKKNMGISFVSENSRQNRDESAVILWDAAECCKTPENYVEYMKNINPNVRWYVGQRAYETLGNACADILKIKNLDMAIEQKKHFIIYGVESHYTNQWMHLLECIGVPYEFIEDEEIPDWYGYHIESVFELPYRNSEDVFVIINKPYEKLAEAIDILDNYDISMEKNNAICIYGHNANLNRGKTFVDVCAGAVPQMLVKENYPCYYVIGGQGEDTYKIMTLGGSTSDSTIYTYDSWPEVLGKMFDKTGIPVIIYNGGISAYSSMQECTKLLRDIKYIKPDMVVSFSGVNDGAGIEVSKGYTYGMEKRTAANWIQNEKMMKIICEQYGAEFYAFVQPQVYHRDFEDKYWRFFTKGCHSQAYPGWREEIEKHKDCPWLIDLSDILDEHLDVYFDMCHVTTKGNQIIAKHIYDHIIDDIR